ncbi:nitrile hydratase accessory protein [Oceanibacterium hippocampi]|uniref:Nitrile hydratase beta subunit n=1 Tax=Oceanibacterium hippocampi TaxID=745714 RepID=A0A1Y5TUC5_9PROT|nr:nitrile hydratase accessory protein [Oceanibacterium hippocampi]SLN73001.1 Nitrile hydratase beta subunit [Oceanibacterium hippocampi]
MTDPNFRAAAEAVLPGDEAGPVFREPWQAQAFAMAVALSAAGHFSWADWAATLSRKLAGQTAEADADGGGYYRAWLAALEELTDGRGLTSPDERSSRQESWAEAYRTTPHGSPVNLPSD